MVQRLFAGLFLGLAMTIAQASPLQAQNLIRDAEIEALLQDYTTPILMAAGLVPENVKLHIVNDPSINAFVTGGQRIFMHTGIILEADTPEEVMGVIAHETGHIAGGHLSRLPDALERATASAILAYILGAAAIAAGAGDAGVAIMASGQSLGMRQLFSYTRGQESAADQAGLSYLERAGINPDGYRAFMEILADQEALSAARQDPYVRTHPLSRDRVNALMAGVERSKHKDKETNPDLQARHEAAQGKIHGFLSKPQAVLRRYPTSDQSVPARYARAAVYHRIARRDDALREIDSLITDQPGNPYFWELKGQILFESGKVAEAVAPHRKSVELAPKQPLLKFNLAQALIATEEPEDNEEAKKLLKDALRFEKESSLAWHQLAIAHARDGEDGLASLASAERFMLSGALPNAMQHAQKALALLPTGSPGALRAEDIQAQISQILKARKSR